MTHPVILLLFFRSAEFLFQLGSVGGGSGDGGGTGGGSGGGDSISVGGGVLVTGAPPQRRRRCASPHPISVKPKLIVLTAPLVVHCFVFAVFFASCASGGGSGGGGGDLNTGGALPLSGGGGGIGVVVISSGAAGAGFGRSELSYVNPLPGEMREDYHLEFFCGKRSVAAASLWFVF